MNRTRIIALAVGAVTVGMALAIAVNVATSPFTLAWARGLAWLAAGVAAGTGIGLAAWQWGWQRRRTPPVVTPPADDEGKPATGEWPPLRPKEPSGSPDGGGEPERDESQQPGRSPAPVAQGRRPPEGVDEGSWGVAWEQRILSVLDAEVSQDQMQIASAARITPGETARTLERLEERGLVVHTNGRSAGAKPERRYRKRLA